MRRNVCHLYKSSTSSRILHKREFLCERLPQLHNQLSALVTSGAETNRASWIDVAGTPTKLLQNRLLQNTAFPVLDFT